MIDPKELRIGNWVQDEGKLYLIDEIGPNDKWEPIKLTPEILKKCGFTCFDRSWRFENFNIREHGSWHNGEPIEQVKYMVYKTAIGAIAEVKTLHQLQNLYFALTDEELTINIISPSFSSPQLSQK